MCSRNIIEDHYGLLTSDSYDQVTRSFWAYDATLQAVGYELLYGRGLATHNHPLEILDLGTGTGNLIESVDKMFSKARPSWLAVDQSEEMLQKAKKKMRRQGSAIKILKLSMQDLEYPEEIFDAVISSFAIHHLDKIEKKTLFKKVYHLTRPQGVFVFGDRFAEPSESHLEVAAAYFRQNSSVFTQTKRLDDVVKYMKKQFEIDGDKPSTEQEQIKWMEEVGWRDVRCSFRSFICGVISGVKK